MKHRTKTGSVISLIVFGILGLLFALALSNWNHPPELITWLVIPLMLLIYYTQWWAGIIATLYFIILGEFIILQPPEHFPVRIMGPEGIFLLLSFLPIGFLILQIRNNQNFLKAEIALSQVLLSAVSDSISYFESTQKTNGEFSFISDGCRSITGYGPEDFFQNPGLYESIIHPDDQMIYQSTLKGVRGSKPIEFTSRIIHKDQSIHWIHHISSQIFDQTKIAIKYHTIHIDITDQTLTKTSIKQTTQLFRQLNQHLKEMIWIEELNPNRIVFMNQPFKKFFHSTTNARKPVSFPYLEFVHPDDLSEVLKKLQALKIHHQPVEFDYRVIRKDSQQRWVSARIFPLMDENNKHSRIMGIGVDITERKQIEADLQFANEALTQLGSNIRELFWIRERYSKEFIYVNPLFEQYFAQPIEAFHNNLSLYYDQIYPEDRIWVQKAEENLFRFGKKFVGEYRMQFPDQNVIWVRTQAYPVNNAEGLFYRVVGITEDISEWKKTEKEIQDFAHQQTILANLQKSALKYNELQQFVADAFLAVNQIIKIQYCTLMEYDRRNTVFTLQASVGLPESIIPIEPFHTDDNQLPGFTLLTPEPVVSSNLDKESRFGLPAFLSNLAINSVVSCSVSGTERVYGVLTFYCEQNQIFQTAHINFFQAIASLISELNLRYQTEKALIASENQYRELIEVQNAGILILNPYGLIQYANPAAENLFATPKDFLIGYAIDTLLDKENLEIYQNQLKKIAHGGQISYEINLNKTPDFPKDVMITAITRVNEQKEPVKSIIIMRDITQQKEQEQELVHMTFYDPLTGIFNRAY